MYTILRKAFAKKRLVIGAVVLVFIGGFGITKIFGAKIDFAQYVSATVQKGTLITSVTGSGQISVQHQIDIKSQLAGTVVSIPAKEGQTVSSGTLLVQLDTTDAQNAVRNAQLSLQNAHLNLQKLIGSDATAPRTVENAKIVLVNAYNSGFNSVANAFLELPAIMTGIQNILYGNDFINNQTNINYYQGAISKYDERIVDYATAVETAYQTARTAYDANFNLYKATSRYSNTATINSLIDETYATTQKVAEAVKSMNNVIQFYEDRVAEHSVKPAPLADTQLASLNTYTGQTNTHLSDFLNAQSAIQSATDALTNASLDIQTQQLSVQQQENSLSDAKATLAESYIQAPINGVVAKLDVKPADSISTGTLVATVITKQQTAVILLNEIDAAKVALGQKVTFTFDAIDGLTMTGTVSQVDTLGTVSQGVVSYNVTIALDTQDPRIKPGMTVNASIITEAKQDVLLAPSSAIKTQGNISYVEIFSNPMPQTPKTQQVEVGLSNDSMSEIISGLNEGDQIVAQTITAPAAQKSAQAPSLFGSSRNRLQ